MNIELNTSYNILYKIYIKKSYLSVELNNALFEAENVNKGLISKIVYGVVERDIALEYIIKQFVKKFPSDETLILLKIGTYVGLFLNSIPKYTIVNELVEISKKFDKNQSGFVNATLKNILNSKITFPDKEKDYFSYLSVKYSYPEWLIKKLFDVYDKETALKLISTKITEMTHIRINTNVIKTKDFIDLLISKEIKFEHSMLDFCLYLDYEKLITHKDLNKFYVVQGLPSIIASLNTVNDRSYNVLDLCSAPGGKSIFISSLNPKINVVACDIHVHRLELVKNYAKKCNIKNITIKQNDATVFNSEFENKFESVLLDVPCTGSGVIVKKPDILLNRTEESLNELVILQKQILEVGSKYVKTGGSIIYSTCSIFPQENDEIIKEFLNTHKEFSIVSVNTYGINTKKSDYGVTFMPYISQTEGFFIGRLVKNAN